MNNFNGKTAVITGAAGGIGLALAKHSAAQGMNVVLADIVETALAQAVKQLGLPAERILAIPTDVRHAAEIKALADTAYRQFDAVHLLFNNAGVALWRTTWEHTVSDCEYGFCCGSCLQSRHGGLQRQQARCGYAERNP